MTLIEVASVFFLVDSDGNILLEHKVFSMCIYEVLASYIPQSDHLLCNVYEVCYDLLERRFVNLSEYLLEKPQPLRKVKSILIKGMSIIIFS